MAVNRKAGKNKNLLKKEAREASYKECPSCVGTHLKLFFFSLGKDVCDRCYEGKNDDYIAAKPGREARIEAAMKALEDPANWCNCGVVARYNGTDGKEDASVNRSGEFSFRNSLNSEAVLVSKTKDASGEASYDIVRITGLGSGAGEVSLDIEESGAWPPSAGFEGMF